MDIQNMIKLSEAEQRIGELEFDLEKAKLDNETLEQKLAEERKLAQCMTKMYHRANRPAPE